MRLSILQPLFLAAAFALPSARAHAAECAPDCSADANLATASAPLAGSSVQLGLRVGSAVAPFHQERFPEVRSELGETRIVTLRAELALFPNTFAVVAVPWVAAGVRQPAGAHLRTTVLANPTLGVRHVRQLQAGSTWRTQLELFGGTGIPLSSGTSEGPALQARALALAAALERWTNRHAYTPGAASLVLDARLRGIYGGWLDLSAALVAPVLLRVRGDEGDAGVERESRALGFLPSTELAASARVWRWLSVSLASSLATNVLPIDPAARARRDDSLQFALAPGALVHLHDHWTVGMDVSLPVSGPLGGTVGLALALRAEL